MTGRPFSFLTPFHRLKSEADAHAEAEYARFAARRRGLLEAEGERMNLRSLEDAAKMRPKKKKQPPKKPDKSE